MDDRGYRTAHELAPVGFSTEMAQMCIAQYHRGGPPLL
jgi:hypothetical protein